MLCQGESAMAAAAGDLLKNLCDEMTCSICLEYFTDPVIVECGHNFCRTCLAQYCGESEGAASCPQCRATVQPRSFRQNRQLANVVDLVKTLDERKRVERKRGDCEKHQEPLKLFCMEDEALICVACTGSKKHREHSVIPAEEAAQECKIRIQAQLQILEEERKTLVDQKLDEEQRIQKCLVQLGAEKLKVRSADKQIKKFLERKKSFWLAQLGDLEKEIEKRWEENVARLSEEISRLTNSIAEMEEKCQQPANELLQDLRSMWTRYLTRYQKIQVTQPVEPSANLEERLKSYSLKHSFFKKALEVCQESLEQVMNTESLKNQLKKVNVILDPDTANPFLVLSEDLKSVRGGNRYQALPNNFESFDSLPYVLGHERFTSGNHWWEVEVEMEDEQWAMWAVGVARESVRRKAQTCLDAKEGIWAVGQAPSSPPQLLAFTSPVPTPLILRNIPRKIRVILTYEDGHVAFFDADTDDLIFTFHSASFSGDGIQPFFWVWSDTKLKC